MHLLKIVGVLVMGAQFGINLVRAREILDSRGFPTIEVDVGLGDGNIGRATAPSGASTGEHEAHELRDNDPKRYLGKGVLTAVGKVNECLRPALLGKDAREQKAIDKRMVELDGTENKRSLGANAVLATSLAVAKAAANAMGIPFHEHLNQLFGSPPMQMPVPMANILNGGAHADGTVDFQEFMVMPTGASSFREGLRWVAEIFHELRQILRSKGYGTGLGDEGGFAPSLRSNEEALDLILEATAKANLQPQKDVHLAMDAAASELFKNGNHKNYCFWKSSRKQLNSEQMVRYWESLVGRYPALLSLEDAMAEDDWVGWRSLTEALGKRVQLVGDDLFVTNPKRLSRGIDDNTCNAVLVKPNQIGTLSETFRAISTARNANYASIISHRSGETEDTTIADLSVASGAGQIKTGSVARSERTAKYNQLLRIEEGWRVPYDIERALSNLAF